MSSSDTTVSITCDFVVTLLITISFVVTGGVILLVSKVSVTLGVVTDLYTSALVFEAIFVTKVSTVGNVVRIDFSSRVVIGAVNDDRRMVFDFDKTICSVVRGTTISDVVLYN